MKTLIILCGIVAGGIQFGCMAFDEAVSALRLTEINEHYQLAQRIAE